MKSKKLIEIECEEDNVNGVVKKKIKKNKKNKK